MEQRVWGVTPPISTALPTEEEKQANDALAKELRAQNTFEAPSETQKREKILKSLQAMADEFVRRAAAEKEPKNTYLIRNARGKIFTYGSYRLGVYGPGSDMDTLVVAPKYVDANQYFDLFPKILVELAPEGAITDLNPVPDAFVPIIKFEFHDISIDLIFCPIQTLKELPVDKDWNLHDNNLLRGLTENQVRSLNGTRVTDEILNLVPEPATFRLAVRAIKLWAQRKAIYANILGYPGGIAWNIMVARVCQLYPKATSAVIVHKFFGLMLKWPWPLPVLLKDIEYNVSVTRVAVWNPKIYHSDRNHRMPIITPSYPSMCTTHNVGQSAMLAIKQELQLGAQVTADIMDGKRPWSALFSKHTFFTAGFKFYLTVTSSSKTREDHNKWSSFIESRVRHLVAKLDLHPSIQLARPFNKGFERVHRCRNDAEVEAAQAGNLAFQVKPEDLKKEAEAATKAETKSKTEAEATHAKPETVDGGAAPPPKAEDAATPARMESIVPPVKTEKTDGTGAVASMTDAVKGEASTDSATLANIPKHEANSTDGAPADEKPIEIFTTNHYIGLQLKEGAKSLDLSREVNEFKMMCTTNDIYDPSSMCITVLNLRNWELPDDVFEPGEVKPVRPSKKKRPAPEAAAGSEQNGANAKRRQTATAAG